MGNSIDTLQGTLAHELYQGVTGHTLQRAMQTPMLYTFLDTGGHGNR